MEWNQDVAGMSDGDVGGLADSFSKLQSLVLHTEQVESFLQQLAELASDMATPRLSCGVTLQRDGYPLTVASSDDRALVLDESQYQENEGPCLQTLASGEVTWVPDVDAETRWPGYVQRARTHGLRCSISFPLRGVAGSPLGAMNVYDFSDPRVLTPIVQHQCGLFAAQASGALQLTMSRVDEAEVRDQLEQSLSSRTEIDQAIGILMGQQRCSADVAFNLLRMRSQSSHLKLRDVAIELIVRVTGQPPQPGRSFDMR